MSQKTPQTNENNLSLPGSLAAFGAINDGHESAKLALVGKKFPVLNDGFVCLMDIMGDDSSIVQAARVSYGKGTKSRRDDRGLIRYMMRKHHTSPFEQVVLKFLVRVPMDCWRQWIRHRTASVNEYSTRFSEAIDSTQLTAENEWRLQGGARNKQGSSDSRESDGLLQWPVGTPMSIHHKTPGGYLSARETQFIETAHDLYQERLKFGIAREQARKDLPLSTYTEAYWTINLHNLLHFLKLRMDKHAQLEIRQYATTIGEEIVAKLLPVTWEAFVDFRLGAVQLSRLDVVALQSLTAHGLFDINYPKRAEEIDLLLEKVFEGMKTEREEFTEKLMVIGLVK